MDDLISRQAAIDTAYPFDDNERHLIDALEKLPSAQQWIPCIERLPMQTGEYIVTILFGDVRWTDKFGYTPTKDGGWYDPDKPNQSLINWNESIIAWMPLPEPCGGDEE